MLDHQVGEAGAVDEDDFLVYGLCVIVSVLHEIAGRDEDTFVGLLTSKRSDEALDLFSPDVALPAFGLHIDHIQPEAVLVDHAVDPFVVRLLGDLGGFFARAAVAHCEKKIDHELFKVIGIQSD